MLESDAVELALQQTAKVIHAKQRQLEDEQKQVNGAFSTSAAAAL